MKQAKRWSEMNTQELAEATKEFDKEFVPSKPLNERQRKLLRAAGVGRGRPKTGLGFKVVSISMERGFLAKIDRKAKKQGLSRSQFLAQAAAAVL